LATGSSRGIGREIAIRLADDVDGRAVHYRESETAAEAVADEIRKGAGTWKL
jgi:NAD(P)-dependent dehydrogenase (short-subunit alcohol dehydrogenase family)